MIECNSIKILITVKKFPSFLSIQRNWLNYQDFTTVYVKQCEIRERRGFSQSQSHIYSRPSLIRTHWDLGCVQKAEKFG